MDVRKMLVADQAAVRVAAESIAARYYPEMIPDIAREAEILTKARTDNRWYARVIGPEGSPYAALIACTGDNLWATKRHSTILLWCSHMPRHGEALLKDYVLWVRAERMLLAGICDDVGAEFAPAAKVLERNGFVKRGGMYVFFPEGPKR